MTDFEAEATVYSIYRFDCPDCGGTTDLGDADPEEIEECLDCGARVRLSS